MSTALLVIDVQSALFEVEPAPYEGQEVVERINRLTQWAHQQGHCVIFIQHEDAQMGYQTSAWALQHQLILDSRDHYVRKTTPDSFLGTNLSEILAERDVKHLIISGYASEFCVDTTVRRAAALGYTVDLAANAHTTHDKPHASGGQIRQHHNATLSNIGSFGVKIRALDCDAIITG
ncbi:isochorismatase family protein [Vibrio olivae]|uniref:Isochorismatase family protein n=1 Tax=Vibrio olivae TaxID=1243002 RepID=A0ABV5HV70_9VIBR